MLSLWEGGAGWAGGYLCPGEGLCGNSALQGPMDAGGLTLLQARPFQAPLQQRPEAPDIDPCFKPLDTSKKED